MFETLKDWDRELFLWLNNSGTAQFDSFWIIVTQIETWIPLFTLFFILLIHYYKWRKGLIVFVFILMAFGITLFITDLTKEFVGRLRPNNADQLAKLIRILQKPTTFSFFSGHASSSFVITTFMVLAIRKYTRWIYLAFVWPIVFVLSRIFVGVHYPSDIIVGALFGTLMAFIFYRLNKKLFRRI